MTRWLSIFVICLLSATISCGQKESEPRKSSASAEDAIAGGKDSLAIELVGKDSVTVLDLLKESHKVKEISTAAGSFVSGIDSISSSSTLFWVYSVNGSNPDLACDKLFTHNGDRVVWHLRKI